MNVSELARGVAIVAWSLCWVGCGSGDSTGASSHDAGNGSDGTLDGPSASSSGGGGSTSSGSGAGSSGSGSGGSSGNGASGSSSGSGGGDAGSDASAAAVCASCVHARCDATAQACAADPTCAAAELVYEQCLSQCVGVCNCPATPDQEDLENCRTGLCNLPCTAGPSMTQTCAPLGSVCDPLDPGYACCVGDAGAAAVTCEQPGTSQGCCIPEGQACDPNSSKNYCCSGQSAGYGCQSSSGTSGTCSTACYAVGDLCDSTMPCCNSHETCTMLGPADAGMPSSFCCDIGSPPGQCNIPCQFDAGPNTTCGF
jgi:hypothetical protein